MRDESLMFSLRRLFEDEKERVQKEREAEERRLEAERQERAESARRLWEAETARQDAEQRRKRAEAQRLREAEVHFEARKLAEVERVKAEVDSRTRLEQVALGHAHDLRMAELGRAVRFQRLRYLTLGSLVSNAVLVVFGSYAYFGKLQPEREQLVASYASALETERERFKEISRRLSDLAQAESGSPPAPAAKSQPETSRAPGATSPARPPRQQHWQQRSTPRPNQQLGSGMDPHDPMNPTLGR